MNQSRHIIPFAAWHARPPYGQEGQMDNVVSFPVTPAIHNRRVMKKPEDETNPLFEYTGPCDCLDDLLVTGVAKVEDIGSGLCRVGSMPKKTSLSR